MADKKFVPKPDDDGKRIHQLHREKIKGFQEANRKKIAEHLKPKGIVKPVPPTPANPAQPAAVLNEAPGGNESGAGAAVPSEGGPAL